MYQLIWVLHKWMCCSTQFVFTPYKPSRWLVIGTKHSSATLTLKWFQFGQERKQCSNKKKKSKARSNLISAGNIFWHWQDELIVLYNQNIQRKSLTKCKAAKKYCRTDTLRKPHYISWTAYLNKYQNWSRESEYILKIFLYNKKT